MRTLFLKSAISIVFTAARFLVLDAAHSKAYADRCQEMAAPASSLLNDPRPASMLHCAPGGTVRSGRKCVVGRRQSPGSRETAGPGPTPGARGVAPYPRGAKSEAAPQKEDSGGVFFFWGRTLVGAALHAYSCWSGRELSLSNTSENQI
jgi:hypothetical protein